MAINQIEQNIFEAIIEGARANRELCIIETTMIGTNERVVVICAAYANSEGSIDTLPLGILFTSDQAMAKLHPPQGATIVTVGGFDE